MAGAISPFDDYCVGYDNYGVEGDGYYLAVTLGVGKVKQLYSHPGSGVLDETLAFDKAEVDQVHIGQTNMITVSSFCGPNGLVWGYHRAKKELIRHQLLPKTVEHKGKRVDILSAAPLIEAASELFGTGAKPKYRFYPGSHVPTAKKSIEKAGPAVLYAAIGIGIPAKGQTAACCLMEDVGYFMTDSEDDKTKVLSGVVESVLKVGDQQKVEYGKVFTEIKTVTVNLDEVGCALTAAPYFALARKVVD